jgi:hypothetical protein
MNDDLYKRRYRIFAVSAGCLIFALAYLNRTTFPFPWNDEARFYLPALWWAEHFSLSPANLHAPQGIFWVPDGFTIFIGLALRFFGETIQVARGASEFVVALGVTLFAFGFRKFGGSWQAGVLATLLLLTPPVVFAANMVRMEAPLFLLIALVLLLHVYGHFLAASSLLIGSLLFHPALGIAAVAYAVIVVLVSGKGVAKRSITAIDWVIVALVAAGALAELFRIVHHWSLFETHMAYQVGHKVHLPIRTKLMKPQGSILLISSATVAILLWRRLAYPKPGPMRDLLPVAGMALGILIYAVFAGEMPYDVYSLSVGPALVFCLVCRGFDGAATACEPEAVFD